MARQHAVQGDGKRNSVSAMTAEFLRRDHDHKQSVTALAVTI